MNKKRKDCFIRYKKTSATLLSNLVYEKTLSKKKILRKIFIASSAKCIIEKNKYEQGFQSLHAPYKEMISQSLTFLLFFIVVCLLPSPAVTFRLQQNHYNKKWQQTGVIQPEEKGNFGVFKLKGTHLKYCVISC